jgi:hypothetical protein
MPHVPNTNRIVYASLGLAALSLLIAVTSLTFAFSSPRDSGTPAPEPKRQMPLTADNPASKLPHYDPGASVVGNVTSVSSDSLVINTSKGNSTVALTSATQFYRRGAMKDADAYQKEIDEFQETINTYAVGSDQIFMAPEPYVKTPIALSDIHVGASVVSILAGGKAVEIDLVDPQQP